MAELKQLVRLKPGVHAEYVGALEALMCSFRNGHYYKIEGTVSLVVEALSRGPVSIEAVAASIERHYTNSGEVGGETRVFFEALQEKGLIEPFNAETSADLDMRKAGDAAYRLPIISENKELADILTLDPIHEVGAEGWPERR